MNRWMKILSVVCVLNGVLPAFALERPELHFDQRTWIVGYQGRGPGQVLVEFVPEGQKIDAWTELVSAQFLIGKQKEMTVPQYVESAKKVVMDKCPAARWREIRTGEEDALYEWSVDACKGVDDQSQLTRVMRGTEGLHVLYYAIKRSPLPVEKRDEWSRLLGETKLLRDDVGA
jgi:hypothetical protein